MAKRLTDKQKLERTVPESTVLGQLMQLAKLRNLPCVHFLPAQRQSGRWVTPFAGSPGWPDLAIAAPPVLYLLEAKRELGKTDVDQEAWLAALEACTRVEAGVVRPSNLQEWLDRIVVV